MTETILREGARKGAGGYLIEADRAECILWDGNLNAAGYGRLWVEDIEGNRSQRYAHRVAWEAFYGPIPEGMTLDHLCVVPACINPKHLEVVTPEENRRRADARVTHCPRRHEYKVENTGYTSRGDRFCRQCHRDRVREYAARRRHEL